MLEYKIKTASNDHEMNMQGCYTSEGHCSKGTMVGNRGELGEGGGEQSGYHAGGFVPGVLQAWVDDSLAGEVLQE